MEEINEMFSKIYVQYDFMNHLLSLNVDKSWRAEATKDAMIPKNEYSVLDIASGTGDLAISISKMAAKKGKKVQIYAYDFNKDMLEVAKRKFDRLGLENIKIEHGNAFKINHKTASMDVLVSGFALRSFMYSKNEKNGLQKFISESYRVVKPGGKVILLDMAMPDKRYQREFFKVYSVLMLAMGSFVDKDTYAWLVRTIKSFDKKALMKMMKSTGFKNVTLKNLRSGIGYIVTAEK